MRRLLALLLVAVPAPALALTAGQVMDKVAPSVWAVRSIGGGSSQQGSALIIGPGRALVSCQAVANASVIQVFRQKEVHIVHIEHADRDRDLCTLASNELKAPAVEVVKLADVKAGQRVYAIGNPEGVFVTLSEGQVSALRADPGVPPILTTASAPPGASGGGLFDDEGRLVGIIVARYSQNQVAALAADWIAEIPARAGAVAPTRGEAPRTGAPAAALQGIPASPQLPTAGSTYVYRWTDRYQRGAQEYTVEVASVAGWDVSESFRTRSQRGASATLDARTPNFVGRRLDGGALLVEFAPYLPTDNLPELRPAGASPRYPGGESAAYGPWTVHVSYGGWEQVSVPAGSYKAMRVNVRGARPRYGMIVLGALRFEYTAWYAPEARRYVKFLHQTWNSVGPTGDAWGELLVYRPN